MEGKKQVGSSSSSSSFTAELFGSKESSSSSSTGIFSSIFAPSSKVLGRESLRSEFRKQNCSVNDSWKTKLGAPDDTSKTNEGGSQSMPNRDMGSVYQEQRVQPCHLSSSIYYGGQDVFTHPQSTQSSTMNSFKKDGTEDDSGSASRGNWWQGSLYY